MLVHLVFCLVHCLGESYRKIFESWRKISYMSKIDSQLHMSVLSSISTPLKYFFSCRHNKNYIIRKSMKNWVLSEYFLRGVWPSPQQDFRKIDFIAYNNYYVIYAIKSIFRKFCWGLGHTPLRKYSDNTQFFMLFLMM